MATEVKSPEVTSDSERFGPWNNVEGTKLRQREATYLIPRSKQAYSFTEVQVQENETLPNAKELVKLFSLTEREHSMAVLDFENEKRRSSARQDASASNPLVQVAAQFGISVDELKARILGSPTK